MTTKHTGVILAILMIASILLTAVALCGCQKADQQAATVLVTTMDLSGTWYADIAVKDHGTVTVKLECTAAPVTCRNFIQLAQSSTSFLTQKNHHPKWLVVYSQSLG